MSLDDFLQAQRQAVEDFRLALGLELKARRTQAGQGFAELSKLAGIPPDTLRSYERGANQPQLIRLAKIANVYGVSALDLLISTAAYIYRANGEAIPDTAAMPADKIALHAVLLYCGATPSQLHEIESHPQSRHEGNPWKET
jgi:transcriptional regulator with XRE-family HTH domain